MTILAIEASHHVDDVYALLDDSGSVLLSSAGTVRSIAKISSVGALDKPATAGLC
jgi:hypothetical protein